MYASYLGFPVGGVPQHKNTLKPRLAARILLHCHNTIRHRMIHLSTSTKFGICNYKCTLIFKRVKAFRNNECRHFNGSAVKMYMVNGKRENTKTAIT